MKIKTPKRGWKYATYKEMSSPAATWIGWEHCFTPESILEWAQKHKVKLYRLYMDTKGLKRGTPQGLCFEKAFWADAPYHGKETLEEIPLAFWAER